LPIPLAHPAAILTLRRWWPRYLDFPALFIGSVTPDLATCIDDWEYFSHTLAGSFVFCLPVGLFTYWIWRRVRTPLVSTFPNPHRDVLLPFCAGLPNAPRTVVVSLLLASWIHIIWDLFTHDHSWLREYMPLFFDARAGMPLNRAFWLISSLGGCAVLAAAYLSLLAKTEGRWWASAAAEWKAYRLWLLLLLAPFLLAVPLTIQDLHGSFALGRFLRPLAMYYLGGAYLTLIFAGFFFRSRAVLDR
jgi:hypothetical protein